MHRIIIVLLLFLAIVTQAMATQGGTVFTDKALYLSTERLHLSIALNPEQHTSPLPSVAYIELSDSHHICVQSMTRLTAGRGWAELALPTTLHSGYYLLSVYTRNAEPSAKGLMHHQVIAVVNPTHVSRADNIVYHPLSDAPDSLTTATAHSKFIAHRQSSVHCSDTLSIQVPSEWSQTLSVASFVRQDLLASTVSVPNIIYGQTDLIYEPEGHIVIAHPSQDTIPVAETQLVMIGRQAAIYDGQPQGDGSWRYYTTSILGPQPILLRANDSQGNPLFMQFTSPYRGIIPQTLPKLQVYCQEEELSQRTQHAILEQAITDLMAEQSVDSLPGNLLSVEPHYSYDLNEYTRFSTVQEILTEFVRGVKREKVKGHDMLFTLDTESHTYSDWPALVLLDGLPIDDVNDILDYDARLLHYVQIYTDRFTFGNTICGGVISFISRQGRLSNYQLNAQSRLVTYTFPQDRPQILMPIDNSAGTCYWNPDVHPGQVLRIPVPNYPGKYLLTLQGMDSEGSICTIIYHFEANQ